jgi:hypothetical protein
MTPTVRIVWPSVATAAVLSGAIALVAPPAFWITLIAVALLGFSSLRQSRRTGEASFSLWRSNDWTVTSSEAKTWAVALTVMGTPLGVALVRAMLA